MQGVACAGEILINILIRISIYIFKFCIDFVIEKYYLY